MTATIILGDGGLGRAVEGALLTRASADPIGEAVRVLGRPPSGRHDPRDLAGGDVLIEASRSDAVMGNVAAALEAGTRRVVIATTGWQVDRPRVEALLVEFGAAAVAAPNFSLGVVLFGRLVETAVSLFGRSTPSIRISSSGTVARRRTGLRGRQSTCARGSWRAIRGCPSQPISRLFRSGLARHRGCIWLGSMPPVRPSSSA